jgi:hypothetical protein
MLSEKLYLLSVSHNNTDRLRDTRQQLLRSVMNSSAAAFHVFVKSRFVFILFVDPPIKFCIRRIDIRRVTGATIDNRTARRRALTTLELFNTLLQKGRY